MRILGFEAHPDDMEHFYSGTLAKYSGLGHQVGIACFTNGDVGSPTLSMEEIARVREQELRNSAAIIGAEVFWMGYHDEFLFNSEEVRRHTIDIVRQFRPDIIITLDKDNDYHPDHCTAGQIVWDIHVMPTVPNIKTAHPRCEKIPEIYFCDTSAGINFAPEIYVNIDDYFETKKKMLRCHVSQETWCDAQYGTSLEDTATVQTRFRGYQAGCKYAECFRKPKFFPQNAPKGRLLEL
jgi:LmbE family N-acetylglucosaminyl deacetylase